MPENEADDAPPGVREQLESLRTKSLLPMDLVKRRRAFGDVVAVLQERSLRQRKKEEYDRFSGSPEELNENDHQSAVTLNELLKRNQELRPSMRSRH